MPPEKALFEAREPSPFDGDGGNDKGGKYLGPERRRENRRQHEDRREEVRFDLKSSDRRENPGRRADDKAPKFW